jgi:hypothetical protein
MSIVITTKSARSALQQLDVAQARCERSPTDENRALLKAAAADYREAIAAQSFGR